MLKRLLIAVVPLIVIWFGACATMTGRIEADLAGRASAAVGQLSGALDQPAVTIDGRDATLSGVAIDPQGDKAAADAADHTFGVRLVHSRIAALPLADPYLFEAKRDDNALVLSGSVPNFAAREALVAAARAADPAVHLVDKTSYASGAPENFATIAGYGLTQAAKLADGVFSLSNKSYSIRGAAATSDGYEAVMAETTRLPGGATLAEAAIRPPEAKPYVIEATRDGAALTLTGTVPTPAARETIVARAAAAVPGASLVNRLGIARGAPQGDFVAATSFALTELGKLSHGTSSLSDGHFSISGVGKDGVSRETIEADARSGLPAGFDIAVNGVVAPAQKSFSFVAQKTEQGIALSGYVPSADDRDAVQAAARAAVGSGTVSGALAVASGLPHGVDIKGAAGLALAELGRLSRGTASLAESRLSVTGDAADPNTAAAVRAALNGSLPAGVSRGDIDIREPDISPYVFEAANHGGTLTLSGRFPDQRTHEEILSAARRLVSGLQLVDQLEPGKGQPGDFAAATSFAIAEVGKLSNGTARLSDGHLSITGTGKEDVSAETVEADARTGLPKRFDLAVNQVGLAEVHPFVFSAQKTEQGITLSGFAPGATARETVLAAARAAAGGGAVSGTLKLASGLPAGVDFERGAALALAELGRLSRGTASLTDDKLAVAGEAADAAAAEAARAPLRAALPTGVTLGDVDIREPDVSPYVFSATKRDDEVRLTGSYPDLRTHEDILALARRRFNDRKLVDDLKMGRGAPADFTGAASAVIEQLSRLAHGEGRVSDSDVSVSGEALYPKAASEIEADLSSGVPKGYKAVAAIGVAPQAAAVDAAGCQSLLTAILARGKITFDTGMASIDKDAFPLLDELAAAAMRCPNAKLQIAGYTDARGSDEKNQDLSRRRSEAVVHYLVIAGIDAARLNAVGYGKASPIASNDSEEGRAKNRRIEFQVK